MIFRKRRKPLPEVNASSTADIAFLLLIFFLLVSSMDMETGMARILSPYDSGQTLAVSTVKERNVLQVRLSEADSLFCNGQQVSMQQLKEKAKAFIANAGGDVHLPEKSVANVELLGQMPVSDKHVIVLRTHRQATYQAYVSVQSRLAAAYEELRDELARQRFGKPYRLLDADRQQALREVYPMRISEAELLEEGGAHGTI